MTEEANTFRNLRGIAEFRCYVPDITPEQAMQQKAFVTRIKLPDRSWFVQVLQIDHPLSGMLGGGLPGMLQSTLAYAYVVDPSPNTKNVYVSAMFPDQLFPWTSWRDGRYRVDVCMPPSSGHPNDLKCMSLGVSTHNGVPLFHASTELVYSTDEEEERLEKDLVEAGYTIIEAKRYDAASKLIGLYKASVATSETGTPPVEEA